MNHFDWTAWLVAVAITTVFVIQSVRIWSGKTSKAYLDGANSVADMNQIVLRFAKSYMALSGVFVSFVVLAVTKYGANGEKSGAIHILLLSIFYLACVGLALFGILAIAIVFSGGPEFLVTPPLRGDESSLK